MAIIRAFGAVLLGFAMAGKRGPRAGLSRADHQAGRAVPRRRAGRCSRSRRRPTSAKPARPNVIVENRSGGGTTIGAKAVAAAAPDGYTLLVVGPNIAYYPVLFPNLDFDPAKALVAGRDPGHVVASASRRPRCRPTPSRSGDLCQGQSRQARVRLRIGDHAAHHRRNLQAGEPESISSTCPTGAASRPAPTCSAGASTSTSLPCRSSCN